MIVAGEYNITIRPGGTAWSQSFSFKTAAGAAIDVSEYAPFAAQVRLSHDKAVLLEGTVDDSDAATGVVVVTFSGSATMRRAKSVAKWDLIDQFGQLWIYGKATIEPTITAP